MEETNRLIGGLNTDVHPSMQPESTMRDCLNFVPMSEDGNAFALTNEHGTLLLDDINFPQDFFVVGHTTLNNDIIVVLATEDGRSQVGYVSEDGTSAQYKAVAPIDSLGVAVEDNSEFGFSMEHPVDCTARKLINGDRVLYYTDNNVPFGQVNLDSPPTVGSVISESSLIFTQGVPEITITAVNENVTSTIVPGATQFITRYVTSEGDVTNFGMASELVSITNSTTADTVDQYKGAYSSAGTTGKSISLKIENIDLQYNEIEIVALYYTNETNSFNATLVATIPLTLTSGTIFYTYYGPVVENAISLTLEELRKLPVSYTKAKCLTQKDNRLFISNVSTSILGDSETLQKIANTIEVSYEIEEVLFSNRGEAGTKGFTDYVKELNTINRGYRRNEVYSLGFYLLYQDGTRSYNYHIPGKTEDSFTLGKNDNLDWDTYNTGSSTGVLGTYISETEYPNNQSYPGNTLIGDDTRIGVKGPVGLERILDTMLSLA